MQSINLTPFRFTAARTSILGALFCAAFLTGCDGASEPVGPLTPARPSAPDPQPITPEPQHNGSIAGFVINQSGECIVGARVELIDGPQAGAVFAQTYCDVWGYGDDNGYSFHDLPLGNTTVRATAKGYLDAEITVVPTSSYSYTTMIVLKREN